MSEPRSGLCLGGPRDGQWLAVPHEFFEVHTNDSIPISPPNPDPQGFVPVRVEIFTYRYWHGFDGIGFWIDARAPFPNVPDVMKRLAEGYEPKLVTLCG